MNGFAGMPVDQLAAHAVAAFSEHMCPKPEHAGTRLVPMDYVDTHPTSTDYSGTYGWCRRCDVGWRIQPDGKFTAVAGWVLRGEPHPSLLREAVVW